MIINSPVERNPFRLEARPAERLAQRIKLLAQDFQSRYIARPEAALFPEATREDFIGMNADKVSANGVNADETAPRDDDAEVARLGGSACPLAAQTADSVHYRQPHGQHRA